jgi:hypothetical protein
MQSLSRRAGGAGLGKLAGRPRRVLDCSSLVFSGKKLIGCLACGPVEVATQKISTCRIYSVGSKLPRRFATVP